MFQKMKINIPKEEIVKLFNDMDINNDGTIEYNELLNYIRKARKEKEKIDRMQKIDMTVQRIREKSGVQEHEVVQSQLTIEGKLQTKISMLELKEKNMHQKHETLKHQLQADEKLINELKKQLDELQNALLQSNKNYQQEKQQNLKLMNELQNAISKNEAQQLKTTNEKNKIIMQEQKSKLVTFDNLYTYAVDHIKVLKVTLEKKKHETDTMHDTIKDLQSVDDEKSLIGRLHHRVMITQWELGETNKKYSRMCDNTNQLEIELKNKETEWHDLWEDFIQLSLELKNQQRESELQISDLKGKILPTVNPHQIDEMFNKINEIAEMKLHLEISNRKLREENYEQTLKCDYYETKQEELRKLEEKLRDEYTDDIHQQLIDMSMQVQDLKLQEMQAKRMANLAKEKEEYYQRVNRQHMETIKSMELEVSNHAKKFAEREDFWRRKLNDQFQLIAKKGQDKEAAMKQEKQTAQQIKQMQKDNKAQMGTLEQPMKVKITEVDLDEKESASLQTGQAKQMYLQLKNQLRDSQLQLMKIPELQEQVKESQQQNEALK